MYFLIFRIESATKNMHITSSSLIFILHPVYSLQFSLKLLHLIARNTSPAFEACISNKLLNSSAQMLQEKKVRMKYKGMLDNTATYCP